MSLRKLVMDIGSAVVGTRQFSLHPAASKGVVYPLDLDFTLQHEGTYYPIKDGAGVPLRHYQSVGNQYNPTRIAAYGLAHFNRFITVGHEESRRHFLAMADWFLASEDARWRYTFDWGDLKAPWISCMSQGEAISVLTRAFMLTQDERYLAHARRAAEPFALPIEAGGVRSCIDGQYPFLEEYPSTQPRHTLNGFLYTLIGVLDLVGMDASAADAVGFAELVQTLERTWQRWDLSYWSAYDLYATAQGTRNPATVTYHQLHISQMRYLASRLDSAELTACADRWQGYARSCAKRLRALSAKIRYRLEDPASR